jgi:protein-tyrosine phosphatase
MAEVLDWYGAADRRDLAHRAAETLRGGGTVCFPTDSVYVLAASAYHFEAVRRVDRFAERPLTVAVRDAAEALEWAPRMGQMARRLARRCWPGPVTLVCELSEGSLAEQLSPECRSYILLKDSVRLRSPDHDAIRLVMDECPDPLIFTGANRINEESSCSATAAAERSGQAADLILDDRTTRLQQASTLVRIAGEDWKILRPGAVPEADLRRKSAFLVVFVCTGNTCRSPLAEALCRKLLAEQLQCSPADLPERGFLVISAGLAAMMGGAAAAEAVQTAAELGTDLSDHRTMPLSPELAHVADCIIAMTEGHLATIAYYYPDARERSRLLRADGGDVADPIGCEPEVYRECGAEIAGHLVPLVTNWIKR